VTRTRRLRESWWARTTPGGFFLPAVLVLCLWGATAEPARGQDEGGELVQRELEYRAARQSYEAALEQLRAEYNAYTRILDEVRIAPNAGDDAARGNALARAYARSQEVQRLEIRVQESRATLDERREGLLAALDARLDEVQQRLGAPGRLTLQERQGLEAQLAGLASQYLELEEQGSNVLTPRNVLYPSIVYDPRDTPSDVLFKIDFAEGKLAQAVSQAEELDGQIQRLDNLLRAQRSRRDFLGQLNRFGDTQVPVGQPGQRTERGEGAVADTAGVALEELPLEQQLATLRTFREQMTRVIEVLEERVRDLRARQPRAIGAGG
jgi:hypothetical protein